jgi:hypothetical protein
VLSGDEAQIPERLWRAISDPKQFMVDEQGVGEKEKEDLVLDLDDVEMLLATLTARLRPFLLTEAADTSGGLPTPSEGGGWSRAKIVRVH